MELKATLKNRVIKGIGYLYVLNFSSGLIKPIFTIFLMRILTPEDYGIIALAHIIIAALKRFEDFGVDISLIRTKEWSKELVGNAQTIKFIITIILLIVAYYCSYLWANLYSIPDLKLIIRLLALTIVFNSFSFIDKAMLIRNLDYKKRIIPGLVRNISAPALTLLFAVLGYNYWSIVYGTLIASFLQMLTFKLLGKNPLILAYNRNTAFNLLSFGSWVFIGNLFFWGYTTVDNAIIGKVLGITALGYYAVAYRWGIFVAENIQGVLPEVLLSAYSKSNNDIKKIRKSFLKVVKYNSLIIIPASIGFMTIADYFINVVLGAKWLPAYEPLMILSVLGLLRGMQSSGGSIFYALNKPETSTILQGITLALLIITIYPLVLWHGLTGAATAITFSFLISFIIQQFLIVKALNISINQLFLIWVKPFIASLFFCIIILFIKPYLTQSLFSLLLLISSGILLYILGLRFLFKKQGFNELLVLK